MNSPAGPPERHCVIRYAKPKSVEEALDLLARDRWRILAGGTDFYPAQGTRPIAENILDINGLAGLRGITETGTHHVFGARTTWTDIVRENTLPPAFDALKQAAAEVGSVQIQNTGSIAGNLCNASPAADGVPPLMVLDAEVELRSTAAVRHVPLAGFIQGNRRTVLRTDELVAAIRVPKTSTAGTSAFLKLGARRFLVISIAMAAARIETGGDGRIKAAAISVGSCSVVARRIDGLERSLVGLPARVDDVVDAVAGCDLSVLMPIDDVRASADYRREAAREIVARAVSAALGQPGRAFRAAAA
jgi:CO/xanthine dehydrogenase FAD-binding subunit